MLVDHDGTPEDMKRKSDGARQYLRYHGYSAKVENVNSNTMCIILGKKKVHKSKTVLKSHQNLPVVNKDSKVLERLKTGDKFIFEGTIRGRRSNEDEITAKIRTLRTKNEAFFVSSNDYNESTVRGRVSNYNARLRKEQKNPPQYGVSVVNKKDFAIYKK